MEKKLIEEELQKNGYHFATIVGDSMMPMLKNRTDLVKIVPVDGVLAENDLPLYKRPTGQYVLHRIIKVKKGYYITCGDNRFLKEKVPYEWIIGVMESFEKDGKTIQSDDEQYVNYIKGIRNTYWKRKLMKKFERWKER